jgi:hypothetical protein
MKKVFAVPTTRLTIAMSSAPNDWATRILAAIETPNTAPSISIMMMLALEMAVTAATPKEWLTQKALTVPFSDWSAFPPSTGRANMNNVLPIGPSVS